MKRVIKKEIESINSPELYRFHVEFADGSSLGSCFCYETYEEAVKACDNALKWSNKIDLSDKCICGHSRLSHRDFSWKPECKVGRGTHGRQHPACLCKRFRLRKT